MHYTMCITQAQWHILYNIPSFLLHQIPHGGSRCRRFLIKPWRLDVQVSLVQRVCRCIQAIGYNLEPNRGYAGERIFGSGVPLSKEDMYILGSSGKSMTSTMAARVVAKGYISWKTTTKEIFHDTVGWSWIVFFSNIQSRVCLTSIPPSKAQPWSLLSATAVALRAWT